LRRKQRIELDAARGVCRHDEMSQNRYAMLTIKMLAAARKRI
jgi:hypothetical protein